MVSSIIPKSCCHGDKICSNIIFLYCITANVLFKNRGLSSDLTFKIPILGQRYPGIYKITSRLQNIECFIKNKTLAFTFLQNGLLSQLKKLKLELKWFCFALRDTVHPATTLTSSRLRDTFISKKGNFASLKATSGHLTTRFTT